MKTPKASDIMNLTEGLLYCVQHHKNYRCFDGCPYERLNRNMYCQTDMKLNAAQRIAELMVVTRGLTEENEKLRNELAGISDEKQIAERLEELEKENDALRFNNQQLTKQLSEQQPEWHSVQDEPPKEPGRYLINRKNSTRVNTYSYQGNEKELKNFAYWMPMPKAPEPPKPKVPTFKDVFLEKFPKACVDDRGNPCSCIEDIFPWLKRPFCNGCAACWNQPYFEPEEEKE